MKPQRGRAPAGPVDWGAVRARLALASQPAAPGGQGDAEHTRAVLAERARLLARPLAPAEDDERLEVVRFGLGRERYALEARYVVEAFRLASFSPLPGAAPPIAGITARRGELLTLLDLRPLLGLPATTLNDLGRVLAVGRERASFGLLVDSLGAVGWVAAAGLAPLPDGGRAPRRYFRGVAPDALAVLDAEALLSSFERGDEA